MFSTAEKQFYEWFNKTLFVEAPVLYSIMNESQESLDVYIKVWTTAWEMAHYYP